MCDTVLCTWQLRVRRTTSIIVSGDKKRRTQIDAKLSCFGVEQGETRGAIINTWHSVGQCAAHIVLGPFSCATEKEIIVVSIFGSERPVRCIMSIIIYATNTIYYYYFCTYSSSSCAPMHFAARGREPRAIQPSLFRSQLHTHAQRWLLVAHNPDKYKMTNNWKFPQAKIAINSLRTFHCSLSSLRTHVYNFLSPFYWQPRQDHDAYTTTTATAAEAAAAMATAAAPTNNNQPIPLDTSATMVRCR